MKSSRTCRLWEAKDEQVEKQNCGTCRWYVLQEWRCTKEKELLRLLALGVEEDVRRSKIA